EQQTNEVENENPDYSMGGRECSDTPFNISQMKEENEESLLSVQISIEKRDNNDCNNKEVTTIPAEGEQNDEEESMISSSDLESEEMDVGSDGIESVN
ncbi:hypothetical protein PMAYCL1PPCAC_01341, partial [Pristionchus mayeri]